ncbi:MAG TPA: universal stress protein [Kofleriaceae bacterium]|jgi:nucleotide-binding universal stress UspA family protein
MQARWIVVGTDFSEGARWALQQAVRLAGQSGAQLALVHAYEDQVEASRSADVAGAVQEQLDAAVTENVSGSGVVVETFVRRGAPWEKLLNVAVEVGADLIVVGATGQRGLSPAANLLGSVAYRVVASSTRSVLISRSPLSSINDAFRVG